MDVQVLGTHFNINSYDDEPSIKTTLLEGRVQVKKGDKNVFLNPGQQVETLDARLVIHNDVDIDAVIAWKNGLIYFEGADLAVIMRQISRWYNIDADYTGDPKTTHLSGKVSRNLSLSQIIKILETSGIDIKMDGKKLIATPKP
jgi:ferric-dicitrate binding protein FerR (iron transport regulator)